MKVPGFLLALATAASPLAAQAAPRVATTLESDGDDVLDAAVCEVAPLDAVRFGEHVDDHIAIEATTLPPQSAMSAPTVYRYVNGDASYRGAELASTAALGANLTLSGGLAHLWAKAPRLEEPALGVSHP